MSYTPTNWKAGDVVTSAKLNKMEQGIAASGGIRVVHLTMSGGLPSGGRSIPITKAASTTGSDSIITNPTFQLDITPNELMDAFDNEEVVIIMSEFGGASQSLLANFYYDGTTYTVNVNDNLPPLTSSDPDEYFTYDPNSESSDDSGDSDDSGGTVYN